MTPRTGIRRDRCLRLTSEIRRWRRVCQEMASRGCLGRWAWIRPWTAASRWVSAFRPGRIASSEWRQSAGRCAHESDVGSGSKHWSSNLLQIWSQPHCYEQALDWLSFSRSLVWDREPAGMLQHFRWSWDFERGQLHTYSKASGLLGPLWLLVRRMLRLWCNHAQWTRGLQEPIRLEHRLAFAEVRPRRSYWSHWSRAFGRLVRCWDYCSLGGTWASHASIGMLPCPRTHLWSWCLMREDYPSHTDLPRVLPWKLWLQSRPSHSLDRVDREFSRPVSFLCSSIPQLQGKGWLPELCTAQ